MLLLVTVIGAYGAESGNQVPATGKYVAYKNFKDIPGLSAKQISDAEKALNGKTGFAYGMMEGSECFVKEDGTLGGYAPLVCRWLTDLFGVKFEPKLYNWSKLYDGMSSKEIDFSGDFSPSRVMTQNAFFKTSPISEREIKYAILDDSMPATDIAKERPLRIAYLRGAEAMTLTQPYLSLYYNNNYTVDEVGTKQEAMEMLLNKKIDIFISDSVRLDSLNNNEHIRFLAFPHLTYKPISITTGNPDLTPIIDVIDKYLDQGAIEHLNGLYQQGYNEYRRYAFFERLNAGEKVYYLGHTQNNTPIPCISNPSNYPASFYDPKKGQWSGISIDILNDIQSFTGLTFKHVNEPTESWKETVLGFLEESAPMATEMAYSDDWADRYIWGAEPFFTDRYALISKNDEESRDINQVLFSRVGVIEDSPAMEMFESWFPQQENTVVMKSQTEGFDALENGNIDLLMSSTNLFSYATNYLEKTNFKVNLLFDQTADSYFAFTKDQKILAGIMNKAQGLVDTTSIANTWEYRTFDYQSKISKTQSFLLVGISALMLITIMLLYLIIRRRSKEGTRLKALVDERTNELADQVKETEAASEAKSSFLAKMSHEMRTPLNAIIGLSELALVDGKLDKESYNDLNKVHRAGETLLAIVNDILDISKIETGKMTLAPVTYDAPSLINDVVTLNVIRIADKPIDFKLDLNPDFPLSLYGDEIRIKQIFNNILSNAFKYTRKGHVTWKLDWKKEGDDMWIVGTVSDTGIGIREEDMEKLFGEYYQLDEKANRKIEGTGLGLAITMRLVKLMDGDITVKSKHGKGSTFTVRVKQGYVSDEMIGDTVASNLKNFVFNDSKHDFGTHMERLNLPYAKILIVDDVLTNLDVAKGMMKPYEMEIDCVTSGKTAVGLIRSAQKRYDAIFMDHMMPEMDGVEAVRIIREEIGTDYAKNIPIIALTANAVMGNEGKFLDSGFQAFLSKPIEISKLDSVIREWLMDEEKEAAWKDRHAAETEENGYYGEERRSGRDRRKPEEDDSLMPGPAAQWPEAESGPAHDLDIGGIDLKAGLSRFGGDEELLLGVLNSFADNTGPLLDRVRDVKMQGLPDYAIVVHGIKSSSRGIGAEGLGSMAEALEGAAKSGDMAFVEANNPGFIAAAEKLISDIRANLDESDGQSRLPVMDRPDLRLLDGLKSACSDYDMDNVDRIMTELSGFRYEEDGELVDWLKIEVAQMNFQGIEERLANGGGNNE